MNADSRLPLIDPDVLTEEQRQFYDSVAGGQVRLPSSLMDSDGRLLGPLNPMLYAPNLGQALQAVSRVLQQSSLSRRLTELVILTVAHNTGSEYEAAAHEPRGYDAGFTHDELAALRELREPELEDPAERTVWRTTVRLVETGDLDDAAYDAAVGVLGERGLTELMGFVGFYTMIGLMARVFRV